jgi:branched-chain amino acid aminotransferase
VAVGDERWWTVTGPDAGSKGASSYPNSWIYYNGEICRYHDVHLGLMTMALHYGTGVFDGTRANWDPDGEQLYLAMGSQHFERMRRSAKTLNFEIKESNEELVAVTLDILRRNGFKEDVYVRPIVFVSTEAMGCRLDNVEQSFAIVIASAGYYAAWTGGIRCMVSSWRRISDDALPARSKTTGAYVNSALAKLEANSNGFDEAILLNRDGHVAEGPVENIFMVKKGKFVTPPLGDDVLEGLTRSMIIELIENELEMEVVERSIQRTELYGCDELFFTGTGARVTGIVEVDRRTIADGKVGKHSQRLGELYRSAVTQKLPGYEDWAVPVY